LKWLFVLNGISLSHGPCPRGCLESKPPQEFYKDVDKNTTNSPSLKVLITSRPENSIKTAFSKLSNIRLRGEDETDAISQDVERVVQASIDELESSGLPRDLLGDLQKELISKADRTFLWTTLMITLLKDAAEAGASKNDLTAILQSRDIDAIYARLLEHRPSPLEAFRMLQIVVAAARPLTLAEMSIALEIQEGQKSFEEVIPAIKYPFENYVKSLCGHFLRVIHERIYLVHQTAKDFLLYKATNEPTTIQVTLNREVTLDTAASVVSARDTAASAISVGAITASVISGRDTAAHVISTTTSTASVISARATSAKAFLAKGVNWQHSMSLRCTHQFLLDICVTYLYLLGLDIEKRSDLEKSSKDDKNYFTHVFLDYAAVYWPAHRRFVGTNIATDKLSRYERLCNPGCSVFEAWVSKHPLYLLNFPGRMFIQGSLSLSQEEVLTFFELDRDHIRAKSFETRAGLEQVRMYVEDEFEELAQEDDDSQSHCDESCEQVEEELDRGVPAPRMRMSNRFENYRRSRERELLREQFQAGATPHSQPARGHSFPDMGSGIRGFIFSLDKARGNQSEHTLF
jgi:hypothetical protein